MHAQEVGEHHHAQEVGEHHHACFISLYFSAHLVEGGGGGGGGGKKLQDSIGGKVMFPAYCEPKSIKLDEGSNTNLST